MHTKKKNKKNTNKSCSAYINFYYMNNKYQSIANVGGNGRRTAMCIVSRGAW